VCINIFSGSYLTVNERKSSDVSSVLPQSTPKVQGSPLKSQLLQRFEDYNDSGYGGSPLPPVGMCLLSREELHCILLLFCSMVCL